MTTNSTTPMRWLTLASAAAMLALLAGCAATHLEANVHTQGNWPPGRAPGTFAFERLPSQLAQPEQQERLERETLPALVAAGFRPVAGGETPDVRVQVAARTVQGQIVYTGPGFGGPWGGPWGRPWGYGWGGARWGGPAWGWGGGWGWGSPAYAYYMYEVAVLILDARTQQSLYESRAHSDGASFDDGTWAALAVAALKDFPLPAVSPRRVTVPLPDKQGAGRP